MNLAALLFTALVGKNSKYSTNEASFLVSKPFLQVKQGKLSAFF